MKLHRFLDTPLALTEARMATMLHDERMRMLDPSKERTVEKPTLHSLVDGEPLDIDAMAARIAATGKSFDLLSGVAVIPVSGVLVHGAGSLWSDETGYASLSTQFSDAVEDPDVRGIALQIASPGGEVSGLFELADTIYDKKTEKPVWAILDDHAYSAAYALASAADKITVPRAGGVGSVGVITMHLDLSKLLEKAGVNVSLITYGDRKADHSPFRPLSEDARGRLQADVNTIGEMFVEMVGRNRKLSRAKVRSTEAGIFMGSDGVELGLADTVSSPQEAFANLVAKVS